MVYVLMTDSLVKIGYTGSILNRIASHRTYLPRGNGRIFMVGWIQGGKADEMKLQHPIRDYAARGPCGGVTSDLFERCHEVDMYIKSLHLNRPESAGISPGIGARKIKQARHGEG